MANPSPSNEEWQAFARRYEWAVERALNHESETIHASSRLQRLDRANLDDSPIMPSRLALLKKQGEWQLAR